MMDTSAQQGWCTKKVTKKGKVMTEQIEAVETPQEDPKPWDLLREESVNNETIETMAKHWMSNEEQLKDALWYFRRTYVNKVEDLESSYTRRRHVEQRLEGIKIIAQRDSGYIKELLTSHYSEEPKFELDWHGWPAYLEIAFQVGILAGYPAETHRLGIGVEDDIPGAREIWERVSTSLRQEDGRYPEPLSAEAAVAQTWRQLGKKTATHPADPRLEAGWSYLWKTAKAEGLCEVFDTLSEHLGVEKPSITQSGTVSVRFSGEIMIPIEEWDGNDIWEAVSEYEVRNFIGNNDGYFEIDEIDTSELNWD
jgi:hypothetical protein